jgi:hypothetical protein
MGRKWLLLCVVCETDLNDARLRFGKMVGNGFVEVLRNIVGDYFAVKFVTGFEAFEACVVMRMKDRFVKSMI